VGSDGRNFDHFYGRIKKSHIHTHYRGTDEQKTGKGDIHGEETLEVL